MNPRRIISIAQLTLRDAVRSRLLAALTALILTALIAILFLIEDNSSPADRLSIILSYSMNAVLFILTVGTLWAACGAVAGDIADRRVHMVLAKPVHRHELWLGKWLGLVAINFVLLTVAALVVAGIIHHAWQALPAGSTQRLETESRLLTARATLLPELPPGLDRQAIQSAMIVPPGGSLTLHYSPRGKQSPSRSSELRFSTESSRPERMFVTGIWQISNTQGESLSIPFTNAPGIPAHILIPAIPGTGSTPVTLSFTRTDTNNAALLLLAPHGKCPEWLVPVGGFTSNLLRAVLMVWCRLAFVAALGVTMGCLLSLPVAVFAAFAVLILLHMGGFIATVAASGTFLADHHGQVASPTLLDLMALKLITAINWVTGPLERLNAIPLLAEGRVISWGIATKALGLIAALYSAAVALPGIWLFNRRELQ